MIDKNLRELALLLGKDNVHKCLDLLLNTPENTLGLKEIVFEVKESQTVVHKDLSGLIAFGIVESKEVAEDKRKVTYKVNAEKYQLFKQIIELMSKLSKL